MLNDSQTTINKAVEVVGVEKPLEFKNIVDVVGDVGIKKHKEVENIATVVEGVDIKKHTEVVKDDSRGEIAAQDTESVIFVVELTKTPMVESKSLKGELWGVDASLDSLDAPQGEKLDELREEEEVGGVVEGNITNKLADDASVVAKVENLEPDCEKVENVGFGGGDCNTPVLIVSLSMS